MWQLFLIEGRDWMLKEMGHEKTVTNWKAD